MIDKDKLKENVGNQITVKMPTGRVIAGTLYEVSPGDFRIKLGVLYISILDANLLKIA